MHMTRSTIFFSLQWLEYLQNHAFRSSTNQSKCKLSWMHGKGSQPIWYKYGKMNLDEVVLRPRCGNCDCVEEASKSMFEFYIYIYIFWRLQNVQQNYIELTITWVYWRNFWPHNYNLTVIPSWRVVHARCGSLEFWDSEVDTLYNEINTLG